MKYIFFVFRFRPFQLKGRSAQYLSGCCCCWLVGVVVVSCGWVPWSKCGPAPPAAEEEKGHLAGVPNCRAGPFFVLLHVISLLCEEKPATSHALP